MERKFSSASALVDALGDKVMRDDKTAPMAAKAGAFHAYLTFAIEALEKVVKAQDADTDTVAKMYGLQVAAESCRDLIKYFEKKCTI